MPHKLNDPTIFERRAAEVTLTQARLAFLSARTAYQRAKAMKKLQDLRAKEAKS